VRLAELDEADEVGALTERVYRAGGWTDEAYSMLLRDARSRIKLAIVLVASVNNHVVGAVTLALPGTPFAEVCEPHEVEVRMLAVDELARRKGIAGLLMDACERRARADGFAAVVLSTEPGMHAAHRLYEGRGYVRQPHRDWHLDDFNLLVYQRRL
jgi:ribosomal protein S18 acetylase RimI-like enzyme